MKKIKTISLSFAFIVCTSCVKDVKDAIDDSTASLECATRLQNLNSEEGNRTCAEEIADINAILDSCSEFLSEEERATLIFGRDNCQDN